MPTNSYPPCFYRVSTKALIYKDNKVLLIKEDNGMWELPGGGLEVNESFTDGIKRELEEEIGVKAIDIPNQPTFIWKLIDKNGVPKIMMAFKVEVDSFDFKGKAEESVGFGFFTKEEIEKMNLHPNIMELPKLL